MSLASEEQWRPVVGYEGLYEVSDHGRVRSATRLVTYGGGRLRRYDSRLLSIWPRGSGYLSVRLKRAGTAQNLAVHRLVLAAFVGPCPPGLEGCHGNGDKTDCSLPNLRWDTPSQNSLDNVRNGTHHQARKTQCPRRHLLTEPNLVTSAKKYGGRHCKACNRAHANVRKAKLRGEPHDFEAWADDHYRRIMQAAGTA